MPTIVTVHGTFASGETTGSRWWQRGSEQEAALQNVLAPTVGEITYQPFIWDGRNSERSRRSAGGALLHTFRELEEKGEPYIAIGHSHGGSVIAFALQLAQRQTLELPNLKRWITVGTPFIAFQKKKWLYSRGDFFVKSIYVLSVLLILAATARYLMQGPSTDILYVLAISGASLLCLAAVTYMISYYSEGDAPEWKMLDPAFVASVDTSFSKRWTAFWHPSDEAILGLRQAHLMQSNLFPPDFATQRYLTMLIPGLPLLAFVMALTGLDVHVANMLSFTASAEAASSAIVTQDIFKLADWYSSPVELTSTNLFDRTIMTILAFPVLAARFCRWIGSETPQMLGMIIVGASFAYVYVAKVVAHVLSRPTSMALNTVTLSQFRSLVDGVDLESERAVSCNVHPHWRSTTPDPLPADICADITAISDRAASAALPKFRAALSELALSEKMDDLKARFAEYLTWDELIHTAYFNSPKFMSLLADECAAADGFTRRPPLKAKSA